jgi:quinol monooxygenase YgiN
MILVTGSFVARQDRLTDAIALSLEHVRRSRAENGCISHAVHQDVENPARLVFVEEWSDHAALAAHFAVPASLGFVKAVGELAVEAPRLTVFEARRVRD